MALRFNTLVCIKDCELDLTHCIPLSQVDHFQPYYTFNKKHMTELRIGAAILREAIKTAEKEEDEGLKVRTAKAEEEMRKKRVCVLSLSPWIFRPLGIQFLGGFLGKGSVFG